MGSAQQKDEKEPVQGRESPIGDEKLCFTTTARREMMSSSHHAEFVSSAAQPSAGGEAGSRSCGCFSTFSVMELLEEASSGLKETIIQSPAATACNMQRSMSSSSLTDEEHRILAEYANYRWIAACGRL